MTAYMC